MKKYLSLFLALVILLLALASCNNETSKDTINDTIQNTDANDTDNKDEITNDDESALAPSYNTFDFTGEKEYRYYERVNAGKYLLDDMKQWGIKSNYRIIKTYDDFSRLVENPTSVPKEVFENNFILIIRTIGTSSHRIATSGGFLNLSYDLDLKLLSIDVHSKYNDNDSTCDEIEYYDYLIVPKNTLYGEVPSIGDIAFHFEEFGNYEYSYYTFDRIDESKISLGESYISADLSKINELLNNCLTDEKTVIHDCGNESRVFILICEKNCYCSVGYKNFHFDGETAFLTYEALEHKDGCDNENTRITLLSIKMENASDLIKNTTKIKILCEKRVHAEKTDYISQ
ncbi:MAG: hypothetical protein II984_11355 [Clostridia bacterium]|nr:hypothetical protein [Clostridia bacterium]